MRGALALMLLVGGTAHADPESSPAMYTHQHADEASGMFVELGGGVTRFENGGLIIHSDTVSFSPQATFLIPCRGSTDPTMTFA